MRIDYKELTQDFLLNELKEITDKNISLRDFGCFDIETTNEVYFEFIDEYVPVMYSWAFQLGENTILGREWSQFKELNQRINDYLNSFKKPKKFVVFVHNLSYEGSFLRQLYPNAEYFNIRKNGRMMWFINDRISYVCSYLISGMKLDDFTEGCEHHKRDGYEFDYDKVRFPDTELTESELQYIENDVIGQREAILRLMKMKGLTIDNFGSGDKHIKTKAKFARKMLNDAKNKYDKNGLERYEKKIESWKTGVNCDDYLDNSYEGLIHQPSYELQLLLGQAMHAGNVCPARKYRSSFYDDDELKDIIIENMYSYDAKKFYTSILLGRQFPVGKPSYIGEINYEQLKLYPDTKAYVGIFVFNNIKLKNPNEPIPYIYKAKHNDNVTKNAKWYMDRRLESADTFCACLTDIDMKIIEDKYDWDKNSMYIYDLWTFQYGYLPKWFRETVMNQYQYCESLPDGPRKKVEKDILNSFYTASANDPIYKERKFSGKKVIAKEDNIEEGDSQDKIVERNEKEYKDAVKHRITSYAWYVWTTAWGRYDLQKVIDLAGDNVVYAGVDSVKTVGPVDLTLFNSEAFNRTFFALTREQLNGEEYDTLGCFVKEYVAKKAKVLNSVCYACEFEKPLHEFLSKAEWANYEKELQWAKDNLDFTEEDLMNMNIIITVSGLNKYRGSMQLYKEGGLDKFRRGYNFTKVPNIKNYECNLPLCTLKYDGKDVEVCGGNILRTEYGFELGEGEFAYINSLLFSRMVEEVKINERRKWIVF